MLSIVLLLIAFICFALAAFRLPPDPHKIDFIAAGLMFWVLAILLPALESLPHSAALHHHWL
jgi:hypothetical protein